MNQIELLSPAGSYESMVAAVNAGCDAVYIGGRLFGARALADNLDNEKMIDAIEYMHARGKRIYLTVNTLLKDNELHEEIYKYLLPLYEKGIDAVIIQDMGVLRFINKHFPSLPIHASTQMTITMAEGAECLKNYGITRFVAARELQLDEIKYMRSRTELEIEAFIHGALCYSYSGQCLLSSMIGGRSGNRGRCAQPCRMEYSLNKNLNTSKYLLSPKDMNTLTILPELMESGINSFKIEGRMKRYEYAAGVTRIYKKYMDLYYSLGLEGYYIYLESHRKNFNSDLIELMDLYNRGSFCEGYYKQHNDKSMMSMSRPNHYGVLVGNTINDTKIKFIEKVNPSDILEIRSSDMPIYEFTLKEGAKRGETITADFLSRQGVKAGFDVFRTKNNYLLNRLKEEYYVNDKKLGINGHFYAAPDEHINMKVWLKLNDETIISAKAEGIIAQQAVSHPITKEKAKAQIMKTLDTAYYFEDLSIDIKGNVFLPISAINELRRKVLDNLKEEMISKHERKVCIDVKEEDIKERDNIKGAKAVHKEQNSKGNLAPIISISVVNMKQLIKASEYEFVNEIYFDITDVEYKDIPVAADIVKKREKAFLLTFPHIFRKHSYDEYRDNIKYLDYLGVDGYIIRNLEQYYFLTNEFKSLLNDKTLRFDYMLYVMNREAACFVNELNIDRMTAPLELNYKELMKLSLSNMELLCYGKIPLMVSAQCIRKNTKDCNRLSYKGMPEVFLDRMNKELEYISHCRHCYNTISYNEPYCLLEHTNEIKMLNPSSIRLSFTTESNIEIDKIMNIANDAINHNIPINMKNYYNGHFMKGII